MIISFSCPSCPQTQIQNDRWLLCFQIQSETSDFKFLRRSVARKTFDAFFDSYNATGFVQEQSLYKSVVWLILF